MPPFVANDLRISLSPQHHPCPGRLPIRIRISIMACVMSNKSKLTYAFIANLRIPMAIGRKLRLIRDNNMTKLRRMRGCCGDYGQPGC